MRRNRYTPQRWPNGADQRSPFAAQQWEGVFQLALAIDAAGCAKARGFIADQIGHFFDSRRVVHRCADKADNSTPFRKDAPHWSTRRIFRNSGLTINWAVFSSCDGSSCTSHRTQVQPSTKHLSQAADTSFFLKSHGWGVFARWEFKTKPDEPRSNRHLETTGGQEHIIVDPRFRDAPVRQAVLYLDFSRWGQQTWTSAAFWNKRSLWPSCLQHTLFQQKGQGYLPARNHCFTQTICCFAKNKELPFLPTSVGKVANLLLGKETI